MPATMHEMGQGHAALGAAHGILDLSLGRAARRPRREGRWKIRPSAMAFSPPGTVISGIRLDIRKWTPQNERLIAGFDPTSLCYSLVENGKAADRHRLPAGWRRADPHPDARPRPVAGPHRRAVATADRDRNLPHAGDARPAAGAVAVAALRRIEDRLAAMTSEMQRSRPPQQSGTAGRTDRTRRRTGGRRGRQPLPLRRQPRL